MSILTTSATAIAATLITAYCVGQFTSKSITSEIEIAAPSSAVWAELADTAGHADWNPSVKYMSGNLNVGSTLEV